MSPGDDHRYFLTDNRIKMNREILDFASVKVNVRNDGGNETSVGSGGLAGMGDPCLRLWEASDLSFTPWS